jgi:hypothetical protein
MPIGDRKQWEKVRPKEVKETGVGTACDQWKTACPKDPRGLANDPAKLIKAWKAVAVMEAALQVAQQKVRPVNTDAGRTAKQLLTGWERELAIYKGELPEKSQAIKDFENRKRNEADEMKGIIGETGLEL